jgi:hypothetical protein
MRKCCKCGVEDRPDFTHTPCNCKGGEVLGHSPDCASMDHFVRTQHLYKDASFVMTRAYADKGWKLKGKFQKFANTLERLICRSCIAAEYEMAILAKECRAIALEVEGNGAKMTMYQVLCS